MQKEIRKGDLVKVTIETPDFYNTYKGEITEIVSSDANFVYVKIEGLGKLVPIETRA